MKSNDYEAQQALDLLGSLCYKEDDCGREENGVRLECPGYYDDEPEDESRPGGKGKGSRGEGYLDEDEAMRFYLDTSEDGEVHMSLYLTATTVRASILSLAAALAYLLY